MRYLGIDMDDGQVLDLVRAYTTGFLEAGGEQLPETAEDVVNVLAEHGVFTAPRAAALGRERAHDEMEAGDIE